MSDSESSDSDKEYASEPLSVEMYARQPLVKERSLAAVNRNNEEEMRMEVVRFFK